MIRVGVIRGGISGEYGVSLKTGSHVLSNLRSDILNKKYEPIDILIDKDGTWHINGLPADMEKVSNGVDIIFNALHGEYGEDGKVQQLLEQWKIPYTGSGIFPSALGYNKAMAKEHFAELGIKTPKHILYPAYQEDFDGSYDEYSKAKAKEVLERLPPPWIVKPLTGGSSMGIHVCKTFSELERAFKDSLDKKISLLIEELIEGKEATVGVIENFRGSSTYALPPIEIRLPKDKNHFDYESKYNGMAQEICPGNFSQEEKRELERLASIIHNGFGLRHYSRSDFIIHPKRGIYAIEVNTLPGLTKESLIPKSIHAIGSSMPEFLAHIIELARQ